MNIQEMLLTALTSFTGVLILVVVRSFGTIRNNTALKRTASY